ncbi:MAG: dihydropteroate synthase [Candidatus Omnitrophica bacterium]|nr:dihydropteroate synthase [Candidatus Omnitrophota bacterium]
MDSVGSTLALNRRNRLEKLRGLLQERNLVMGVLNVTPDSFSDGGQFLESSDALEQALRMESEGADLLDIGGESSRPGADPVSVEEELERILPVIEAFRLRSDLPISVDTYKCEVARACFDAGADVVNDITAGRHSREIGRLVSESRGGMILMHMRGLPKTMQQDTEYAAIVEETRDFLRESVSWAVEQGLPQTDIWIDPGIGFGKSAEGNLEVLANLAEYDTIGSPLVVGISRKSFIGKITGRSSEERLSGTLGLTGAIASDGVFRVHRVHDVGPTVDCLRMVEALNRNKQV